MFSPMGAAARTGAFQSLALPITRRLTGRSLQMGTFQISRPRLYIYNHCPFCVRAMMVFGLKSIPRQLLYLDNDDIETPTALVGRKVVPILEMVGVDGSRVVMAESLDIVKRIDEDSRFGPPLLKPASGREDSKEFFSEITELQRRLTRPRFAQLDILPEFHTASARETFIRNHPLIPPSNYMENFNNKALIDEMSKKLLELEPMIYSKDSVTEGGISYDDIDFFGKTRGLTVIKGLKIPPKLSAYLENMSKKAEVPLCYNISL